MKFQIFKGDGVWYVYRSMFFGIWINPIRSVVNSWEFEHYSQEDAIKTIENYIQKKIKKNLKVTIFEATPKLEYKERKL